MTISSVLQEMADELIPGASSLADKEFLKAMRKLYYKDAGKFSSKLSALNKVREAKGLDRLHPNEIFSKSLKKDIELAIKKVKYDIEDQVKDEMDMEENFFTIINIYVLEVFRKDVDDGLIEKKFIKTIDIIPAKESKELWQKAIKKLEEGEDRLKIYCLELRFRGQKFVLFVNVARNSFEVIYEYNTPVPYKVKGNEIRFPKADRKLVYSMKNWKLKKL